MFPSFPSKSSSLSLSVFFKEPFGFRKHGGRGFGVFLDSFSFFLRFKLRCGAFRVFCHSRFSICSVKLPPSYENYVANIDERSTESRSNLNETSRALNTADVQCVEGSRRGFLRKYQIEQRLWNGRPDKQACDVRPFHASCSFVRQSADRSPAVERVRRSHCASAC